MPELRHDPIQRHWVIIASERVHRPTEYQVTVQQGSPEFCPFCPCNEDKTPQEILAVREGFSAPNSPGWSIRVVPNKYPALRIEGELNKSADGVYDRMNGIGAHEIIIETPQHTQHIADQPIPDLTKVLWTYRERVRDLMRDSRFLYIVVFRNHGESAGATLAHPHSQIIATPIIPRVIEIELQSARQHFQHHERCLFCDILRFEREREAQSRVVLETKRFLAYAPYASRSPFELILSPLFHHSDFSQISDEDLEGLATILSDTLKRLRLALNNAPFNLVLHMAPNRNAASIWQTHALEVQEGFHWHFEIIPRLTKSAGFEWGTGFHINPVPPEQAADFLRHVQVN